MAFSPFAALAESASVHSPQAIDTLAAWVVFFPCDGSTDEPRFARSNGIALPPFTLKPGGVKTLAEFQGMRRGKITALRLCGHTKKAKAVFLMQCDCGRYAFRKIETWASRAPASDACSVCQQTEALSHRNKSRERHGVRRAAWLASMREAGITSQQCELIEKYSLDTDDLQWLKGALTEIESLQAGGR